MKLALLKAPSAMLLLRHQSLRSDSISQRPRLSSSPHGSGNKRQVCSLKCIASRQPACVCIL